MARMRSTLAFLSAVIATALAVGLSACQKRLSNPPQMPPIMEVDIFLFRDHPPETDSGDASGVEIAGRVVSSAGDTLDGILVRFESNPGWPNTISPNTYTWTDRTKPNGFRDQVRFYGRVVGQAVIWGIIYDERDQVVDRDSVGVYVRRGLNQ